VFGKLQTTDDENIACSDEAVIKNLGTTRVSYYRIEKVRTASPCYEKQPESKPIHEKTKKAQLSHRAV